MTEQEIRQIVQDELNKFWSGKRTEIRKYIDDKLGVSKVSKKVFIEPSVEEVITFVDSAKRRFVDGNTAEKFVNFYGSKGWMVGKNKMKDWTKAVCNGWTEPGGKKKKTFSHKRCTCGKILDSGERQRGTCLECDYKERMSKENQ